MTDLATNPEALAIEKTQNVKIKARDGAGHAIRTVEQAERDHEAAALRAQSKTYREIGEIMGVALPTAAEMVKRAIADVPTEGTKELVALELAKLDFLEQQAALILGRDHPYVTMGGKLVSLLTTEEYLADPSKENDKLLQDDTPKLQAMNTLLKIAQQRAKLQGLYAPTRAELSGAVTVTVEDRSQEAKSAVLGLLARLKDEPSEEE